MALVVLIMGFVAHGNATSPTYEVSYKPPGRSILSSYKITCEGGIPVPCEPQDFQARSACGEEPSKTLAMTLAVLAWVAAVVIGGASVVGFVLAFQARRETGRSVT